MLIMYYKRIYADKIKSLSSFFPVIILTGARQSGKTTLLQKLFPKYRYVSLDLPSLAERAEQNPDEFFRDYPSPLIIDEVQYAPGLFRHIKRIVDKDRHSMGRYVLTGSQKFSLMKEVSDSLAGRSVILELENFSCSEILSEPLLKPTRNFLQLIMTRGQFPELWRDQNLPSSAFYSSYLATYLERDVRQILNVSNLRDFERFIRVLAPRSGQLLNKSEIARDTGVSVKAINDWISVLEASNQIILLEPWFRNISKRVVKSPKLYFCDSGLLSYLLGVSNQIADSPFKGQIWETLVFSEIRKINRAIDNPSTIWFYRDTPSREIDFVIERGGLLSFLECKWKEHPQKKDGKTIEEIHKDLVNNSSTYKPGRHYIICQTENAYSISPNITAAGLNDLKEILS